LSHQILLAQLALHEAVFEELLERGNVALTEGRPASAASLASMAADVAARNHIGRYADHSIERFISDLSAWVPDSPDAEPVEADVVHLVTEVTTRAVDETVRRWIEHSDRRSVVVSTGKTDASVLERAGRIRVLLSDATMVVVHTDPDDLIAALALSAVADRPSVVHVNHHDRSFWAGVGIADLVVSHDATGTALAVERRFVSAGRTLLLPPLKAEAEAWERVLTVIEVRADQVSSALLPPPSLPRPPAAHDFERLELLHTAGRSDGTLGAYTRHGRNLALVDRPELSVVVLGVDPDRTIECLHRVLEVWTHPSSPQLIVVDRVGSGEMFEVLGELTGTVRVVHPGDRHDVWAIMGEGLRWAWGPHAAIIADDSVPVAGSWDDAIDVLESDPSKAVAPVVSAVSGCFDGVMVRTNAGSDVVEHPFVGFSSAEMAFAELETEVKSAANSAEVDFTWSDHR